MNGNVISNVMRAKLIKAPELEPTGSATPYSPPTPTTPASPATSQTNKGLDEIAAERSGTEESMLMGMAAIEAEVNGRRTTSMRKRREQARRGFDAMFVRSS